MNLKIPFCNLKAIEPFSHTSKVMLSLRFILWPKVKSLKVENTSFWKVKCCEVLESMNQISLQTTKTNKIIAKV
jgi:hypothetical protein